MRIIVFNGDRSIFAAFYDITERKQAEVQIQQALAKEQELNQLKSYFISMISHQFRTPLTKILGSAELLKYYSESWSQDRKWAYFDRIEHAVKHMIKMLDDILLIAHAESGRLSFDPAPLNLSDFCQTLLQEFQIDDRSDPKIGFSIDEPLTEAENQLLLDAKLLEQILTNLLSNAIKYSPAETKVWFSVRIQEQTVVFTVKDGGIGIPDQDIPHLFDPFHRCKNVKKIPGTGLGLTIVKKAADLHGAEINVESKSGVGTTFTVTIPV